ncbi:hypothetical protein SESBI_07228 [Sesbania bispinosa]|nr:hypothetical protein SESBI_07228 [Sesbania bispinosa]
MKKLKTNLVMLECSTPQRSSRHWNLLVMEEGGGPWWQVVFWIHVRGKREEEKKVAKGMGEEEEVVHLPSWQGIVASSSCLLMATTASLKTPCLHCCAAVRGESHPSSSLCAAASPSCPF